MRKIKSMCVFMLLITALFLTSCSERIDAGSEGILVNLYGSDKGVDDVSFSCAVASYVSASVHTGFGSLLAFKTKELAEYAGKQFIDLWADFCLTKK